MSTPYRYQSCSEPIVIAILEPLEDSISSVYILHLFLPAVELSVFRHNDSFAKRFVVPFGTNENAVCVKSVSSL